GSAMTKNFTPRPHGNHNPQHGGQFFMAPDNWHHLEGMYPRAGVFRLYLYDDYTKPLPRDQQRQVAAQVVVQGRSYPLALASNGRYLEGKIGAAAVPASMQAKVKFKADGAQNVFDFTFDKYSKEPPAGAPLITKAAPGASPVARANPGPGTKNPEPGTPNPEPGIRNPEPVSSGVEPALIPLPPRRTSFRSFRSEERLRLERGAGGTPGEAGPPSERERGWGPASIRKGSRCRAVPASSSTHAWSPRRWRSRRASATRTSRSRRSTRT